jgi:PPOX class probable F420-dependent enzyme
MSDRDLLRMSGAEVAAFLEEGHRAQVATSNADGTIHLVPLSYFVRDGCLSFWTDPQSRKVANLRRNPQVTCLVEIGSEFSDFRAVQICGRADVVTDLEESRKAGEALLGRYSSEPLDEATRGYIGMLASERVLVTVRPERVVSWDHRKLSGARPETIGR